MRLIDADKIDFNEVFIGTTDFAKDTRETAQNLIDAQPTIEAAPVVHGEWVKAKYDAEYECSNYHCIEYERLTKSGFKLPNFCPNCGAKMRTK